MKKFKLLQIEYLVSELVHNGKDFRVVARFGRQQTAREFPKGTPRKTIDREIKKDFHILF